MVVLKTFSGLLKIMIFHILLMILICLKLPKRFRGYKVKEVVAFVSFQDQVV